MRTTIEQRAEAWVRHTLPGARPCCRRVAARAYLAGWRARQAVEVRGRRAQSEVAAELEQRNERLRRLTDG